MIEINESNTRNAIQKARTEKPLVKVITFGKYEVVNKATGASYQVECKKANGRKLASCTCPAGQQARFVCKHIVAAASRHCQLATERQATR